MIVSLIKINEQMKTILRENQRQDQLIQISIITNSRNLTSHRKPPYHCVLEPTLVYNNLSVFPVAKVCLLCVKADTSHLCDGSAHSSGCVVNGSNAMAAV